MIDTVSVGNNIRAARNESGLTQDAVAKQANLTTAQLSSYETGKQLPGLVSLANIATVLGTSIDRLYFGTPSEAIVNQSSNLGETVVNCIEALIDSEILIYEEPDGFNNPGGFSFKQRYYDEILNFYKDLSDYKKRKNYFDDGEIYIKQLKRAAVNEINSIIGNWKLLE